MSAQASHSDGVLPLPRVAVLDNGPPSPHHRVPYGPLVSVWCWYGVGSEDEGPGLTGASHWVEHMNFKGTAGIPVDEFKQFIDRFGGFRNGDTWIDQTTYAATATAFKAHPYRHPTIGWVGDLHAMNRDDLYGCYRRHYTPTGRRTGEPQQTGERRLEIERDGTTGYLKVAYHAPAVTDPDFAPMLVLDAALTGAKGLNLWASFGGPTPQRRVRCPTGRRGACGRHVSGDQQPDGRLVSTEMTLTSGLAPVREQLANGVKLIVAQTPTRPAVTISAAMAAGSLWDPSGAEGTAHLLSRVLDRAAGTRTADEMADVLDLYGVSPTITVSRHTTTVSCDCLAEDVHSVLGLVGDMLQAPACVDADVELCRGQVLTRLREDEDSPATRALEAVMPLLYGAQHLYGRATKGSPATVEPITPSQLLDFHAARFGPDRLTLVMVGDITVSAAVAAGLTRSSRRRSHCPRRQGADGASFRCLRNRRRISCKGSRRSCDQTLRSTLTGS